MPEYRRLYVPGSSYFFTLNLAARKTDILTRNITALRQSVAHTRARHPFTINACVVLPDHLHAIWTLPEGDQDFSIRWSTIKRLFSWSLPKTEPRSSSRQTKRERGIWQRRFWEHMIRDDQDFRAHTDYIHYNPVKHALAPTPADWPYSTYHRAVARGEIPPDWSNPPAPDGDFGERPPDSPAPSMQTGH